MSKKLSSYHKELLRKDGRFPDDYKYIGIEDGKIKFKNNAEGFVIKITQPEKESII